MAARLLPKVRGGAAATGLVILDIESPPSVHPRRYGELHAPPLAAVVPATLLRLQGLAVLQRVQESVARNEIPVEEVFTGLCLLVAGVLLLTPGFFTDALGFLMFVPSFREIARMGVWRWLAQRGHVSMSGGPGPSGAPPGHPGAGPDGPVIDGDYEEVDPRSPDRDRIGRDEDGKS